MRAGRWLVLAGIAAVGTVTGCAGATEPLTDPEVPLFSTPAPPGRTDARPVPNACGEVATLEEIGTILGVLVTGQVLPIVGVAQHDIGRTARLDCYYGVPAGKPNSAATVWIGLASYTEARWAKRRMTNTVADEREAGAQASDVPVGGDRGVLVRGTSWMLVAARGSTTVVVTVRPNLVRDDQVGAMLGQLADKVLSG